MKHIIKFHYLLFILLISTLANASIIPENYYAVIPKDTIYAFHKISRECKLQTWRYLTGHKAVDEYLTYLKTTKPRNFHQYCVYLTNNKELYKLPNSYSGICPGTSSNRLLEKNNIMEIKKILILYSKTRSFINKRSPREIQIFNSCYCALIFTFATMTINSVFCYNEQPLPLAASFLHDPEIQLSQETKELLYVFTKLSYNNNYRYKAALCWTRYDICQTLDTQKWTLNDRHAPIAKIIDRQDNVIASLEAVNTKRNDYYCRIKVMLPSNSLTSTLSNTLNNYKIKEGEIDSFINLIAKAPECFFRKNVTAAQQAAVYITQLVLRGQLFSLSVE